MFKHYIHKTLTLPPHVTVKKAANRIKREVSEVLLRRKNCKVSSYAVEYLNGKLYSYFPKLSAEYLLPHAETISCVTKHYLDHRFDLLCSGWVQIKHGMRCSGLEGYQYDMGSPIQADPEGEWLEGRINPANLEESKRIWKLIFYNQPKIYIPIDWHLDFKSGFRWSESTWHKDVRYGHRSGVDVKVPWELARMQHLSQLALAYTLAAESSKLKAESSKLKVQSKENRQETEFENQKSIKDQLELPEQYAQEFRSQVLDFIATNPPRFGVNWACTMDVGIRVSNWLMAYDLFCACGAEFDREFEMIFHRSVYEHGRHIVHNLEWSELFMRSNHYLSNIVGLLFVAAYLPRSSETDAWLAFGVQELIKEVELQFHRDGGNREASTSYHRLSSELVIYATALVLGLPEKKLKALYTYKHKFINVRSGLKPSPIPFYPVPLTMDEIRHAPPETCRSESPFPTWYFERLEKMSEFTMHITKPDFHVPQIGDNDSGRFIKLNPVYEKSTVSEARARYNNLENYDGLPDDANYLDEDILDHRHLVAAFNGLFYRQDFAVFCAEKKLETEIIRGLAQGLRLQSYHQVRERKCPGTIHAGNESVWQAWCERLETLPGDRVQRYEMLNAKDAQLLKGPRFFAYPDFCLYIFKFEALYMAVRCVYFDPDGIFGHSHNDNLGVELNVHGNNLITDPGSFLYTPLPEIRNRYRSVTSHFAPRLEGIEQANLGCGLFWLVHDTQGECHYFGERGFIGSLKGKDWHICRIIEFGSNYVTITDGVLGGSGCLVRWKNIDLKVSNGYGKQTKRAVCFF